MSPELEKTNLEVHIELTKIRDQATSKAIEDINDKITNILGEIINLKKDINILNEKRNSQIIHVGAAIITLLLGMLGALLIKVLIPLFLGK